MSLTDIEAVRLRASDKSSITRDTTVGTGTDSHYKLKNNPVLTTPPIEVRKNGILQAEVTNYTVNLEQGIVDMVAAPAVNDELEFTYYWSIFSDAEVQYFIEAAGGNITIATAQLLLAWAADAAKLAKRQTLSGGGGLGQVVIDTSVAAKELRATAKALLDNEAQVAESIPADGLTEVPWNEQTYHRQVEQHVIRTVE